MVFLFNWIILLLYHIRFIWLEVKTKLGYPNKAGNPGLYLKYLLPLCLAQVLSCLYQNVFPENGELRSGSLVQCYTE